MTMAKDFCNAPHPNRWESDSTSPADPPLSRHGRGQRECYNSEWSGRGNSGGIQWLGEFWATKDQTTADWFAMTNPANGQPARLEFDLPLPVLITLLSQLPIRAYLHGADDYEFLPGAYQLLNQSLQNRRVISPVP
jgi:hypothetical protein